MVPLIRAEWGTQPEATHNDSKLHFPKHFLHLILATTHNPVRRELWALKPVLERAGRQLACHWGVGPDNFGTVTRTDRQSHRTIFPEPPGPSRKGEYFAPWPWGQGAFLI